METARRLERLPALAAAARSGELSASQVAAVAWALVDGRGKRAFVAPDDPRHPRRAGRVA